MTPLCHLDDVPPGTSRGFDPGHTGRDTLFAVRRGDGLRVYRDNCPHANSPMAWRKDAYLNHAGDAIVCFAHGALFDVDTGACTLGPCIGQSLQAVAHAIDAQGYVRLIDKKEIQE